MLQAGAMKDSGGDPDGGASVAHKINQKQNCVEVHDCTHVMMKFVFVYISQDMTQSP